MPAPTPQSSCAHVNIYFYIHALNERIANFKTKAQYTDFKPFDNRDKFAAAIVFLVTKPRQVCGQEVLLLFVSIALESIPPRNLRIGSGAWQMLLWPATMQKIGFITS
jgi:hypothetical protein